MDKIVYAVKGMTCANCAAKIKAALAPLVETVEISLKMNQVRVGGGAFGDIDALNEALASAGDYTLLLNNTVTPKSRDLLSLIKAQLITYKPLLMIFALVLGLTFYLYLRQPFAVPFSDVMMDFMGLFFVIFAFFKLLNLSGFAQAFRAYDVVARQFSVWGYMYPFFELGLGIAYLMAFMPVVTSILTLVLMAVGTVGVVQALRSGRVIQCACIGSIFNLPMSVVTVIENGLMAAMALYMVIDHFV